MPLLVMEQILHFESFEQAAVFHRKSTLQSTMNKYEMTEWEVNKN